MDKQKANCKPILFTLLLAGIAAFAVMYFTGSNAQQTEPKIRITYFKDINEYATTIEQLLHSEIGQQKYFWIGYEPEKENQIQLTNLLKKEIEKQNGAFDIVIVDKELALAEEQKSFFAMTHYIPVKENYNEIAEMIKANKDKKILVITAAVYSSNLIENNSHKKVNDLTQTKPLVLSLGFFPAMAEEERFNVFKCDTEDKTGTAPWGCTVINKSRAIRRRIDLEKLKGTPSPVIGLVDATGDADYMILVGK